MATPNVKLVPVVLDRTRHLLMDLNALCEAEELTGKNFMQDESWDQLSFRDVRSLAFACLKHEDPELTPEQLGRSLHPGNIEVITQALQTAMTVAMPDAPKKEAGEAAPLGEAAETGKQLAAVSTS